MVEEGCILATGDSGGEQLHSIHEDSIASHHAGVARRVAYS